MLLLIFLKWLGVVALPLHLVQLPGAAVLQPHFHAQCFMLVKQILIARMIVQGLLVLWMT